jgi:hypothetical protein
MGKGACFTLEKRFMTGPIIVTKCCWYINTADGSPTVQPDPVTCGRCTVAARPFLHDLLGSLSCYPACSLTCRIVVCNTREDSTDL